MITPNGKLARGLLLALIVSIPLVAAAESITLHSGNGIVGAADSEITFNGGFGGVPLSASAFTAADFDSACSGFPATIVAPFGPWLPGLACNPDAKWIGVDVVATPTSALYCHPFEVETCCIESATLTICWATDDNLGDDGFGGPNPHGVYLNGFPVPPGISGGDFLSESSAVVDVTGLIACERNNLQIYNRDAAHVVSGVIYSATIDIVECTVPVEQRAWGSVKSLY